MNVIYGFLFSMWILILLGGGIVVTILGPISITGFGEFDQILSSGVKGVIAIMLVFAWIVILHKLKNWIFIKQLRS